ncbi:hypothetical protein R3P38DRAFT_3182533 [Favolaschia claudopus]|uniref:F-box domain-containing protein n=1 Tax=Favolaschia claudopus TaxID=2862362 RepID=A0AAW0CG23_9AGAR
MPSPLPPELWQPILDYLHNDLPALRTAALICHAWLQITRYRSTAVELNALLTSPHTTIPPVVQTLNLPDSLLLAAVGQLAIPGITAKYTTIIDVTPRLVDLQNIREISLTDVPIALLSALSNIERLTLTKVPSPSIPRAVGVLGRLKHLILENITPVPLVPGQNDPPTKFAEGTNISTVIIRDSMLRILPWIAVMRLNITVLAVDQVYRSELHYLAEYLLTVSVTLRELELSIAFTDIRVASLSALIAPCKALQLLRLRFSAPAYAHQFFADTVRSAIDHRPLVITEQVGPRVESLHSLEELLQSWVRESCRVEIVCPL